jgi:predicted outer membrane protein
MNRFKRNFWMSSLMGGAMVLGAGPAFASPNPSGQQHSKPEMGMHSSANEVVTSAGKLQASDAHALWLLHKIDQGEIAQAQLAQSRAKSDKVKDLAGDLLDDHKGMDEKVLSLAKDNDVTFAGEAMGTGGAGNEGATSPQEAAGTESTSGGSSTVEELPNSGTGGAGAMGQAGMTHGQLSASDQAMLSKSSAQLQKLQGLQGRAFDRAFLKGQVKDHQKALSALRGITAQNEDVKGLLEDAIPTLEKHEKESREALQAMRGVGGSGDESGMQNGDQDQSGEGNWMQQSPDSSQGGTSEGTGTSSQPGTGGAAGSSGSGGSGGGGTP